MRVHEERSEGLDAVLHAERERAGEVADVRVSRLLVPRLYPLADHFPAGTISADGTNQMPVSPRNVVVAGRVACSDEDEEDCELEELEGVCAPAVPAQSAQAAITAIERNGCAIRATSQR